MHAPHVFVFNIASTSKAIKSLQLQISGQPVLGQEPVWGNKSVWERKNNFIPLSPF